MSKLQFTKDSVIYDKSKKRFVLYPAGSVIEGQTEKWRKRWIDSGRCVPPGDAPAETEQAKPAKRRPAKPAKDKSPIDGT